MSVHVIDHAAQEGRQRLLRGQLGLQVLGFVVFAHGRLRG